jgi:hypothetical protein
MNSKHVSVAVVALLAATGAWAAEDYSAGDYNAGDEVTQDRQSDEGTVAAEQDTGKPYAQSDAMDLDWIFIESPAPSGAAGPVAESDLTPDPSTSGDGMSLHWIAE